MSSSVSTIRFAVSFTEELLLCGPAGSYFSGVIDSVSSNGRSEPVGDELDKEVNEENCGANTEGDEPLVNVETIFTNFEHDTSELRDEDLKAKDEEPYGNEDHVGGKSFEGVQFIMNLARAEHVHNLEHHEGGEEESKVARRASGVIAHFCTSSNTLPDGAEKFTAFFGGNVGLFITRNCLNFFNKILGVRSSSLNPPAVERCFASFGPDPVFISSSDNQVFQRFIMSSSNVRLRDEAFSSKSNGE